MPIYTLQGPDGKTYDIEGPEGATAEQLGAFVSNQKPEAYDVPPGLASAMNVGQAITFGFGDDIAGKVGLDKGRYQATVDKFREENPKSAALGSVSGSLLLPGAGVKALSKFNPWAVASAMGGGIGALTGYGESKSENATDRLKDAAGQGAGGMVMAPFLMGATKAAAPIASVLGNQAASHFPGVGEKYSQWLARNRVADSFSRDNVSAEQVRQNMYRLGAEARVADAAGENTRGLLDLNANLPGKTKDQLEQLIRERIASRPDRMDDIVYAVNGGYGRAKSMTDALSAQQLGVAAPLYKQAHALDFAPSPALVRDLEAARKLGAWGEAGKRSLANPENGPFSLDPAQQFLGKGNVAVRDIDHIKQGIDSLIERETNEFGKVSGLGRDLVSLKNRILGEVDSAVPVYKEARNAFAGPAALKSAIQKGQTFWNESAESIGDITKGMTASELEAFKIGASEQLRAMVGGQTGQNRLLNMWKDRNTREKLQALLGDDVKYDQVQKMIKNEETLKRLESLGAGRNSRTFSREAGAEQQTLDNAADLVAAGLSAKTGGLSSLISGLGKYSSRVGTPEPVRNAIGQILMGKYQPEEMKALELAQKAIAERKARTAAASGVAGGLNGLLDF